MARRRRRITEGQSDVRNLPELQRDLSGSNGSSSVPQAGAVPPPRSESETCEGISGDRPQFARPGIRDLLPESSGEPIRYELGEIVLTENDLRVEGLGAAWGHTRTYSNQLQGNQDTDFGNGFNWIVGQWSELVEVDSDTIVVLRNPSDTVWFDRQVNGSYQARYGAQYALEYDQTGQVFRFFTPGGFVWTFHDLLVPDSGTTSPGKLKELTPAGETASQVLRVTQFENGRYKELERGTSVIERFTYEYAGGSLQTVTLTRGGLNVRRVSYTYHVGTNHGSPGDLRTASIDRWAASTWEPIATSYYRYYKAGDPNGFEHGLKYVVGPDAYARLIRLLQGASPDDASEEEISSVADRFFMYDTSRRVVWESVAGGSRTYTFQFTDNSSPQYLEGANTWNQKTIETRPDDSQVTVYTNYIGQVILRDLVDNTGMQWIDFQQFDNSSYQVLFHYTPSVMRGYQEQPDGRIIISDYNPNGLTYAFEYDSSHGNYLKSESVIQGLPPGQPVKIREYSYQVHAHAQTGKAVYVLGSETEYRSNNAADPLPTTTTYEYQWHTQGGMETNQVKERTTTFPVVPPGENGDGLTHTRRQLFDVYGNETFEQGACLYIRKQIYDVELGVVLILFEDYDGADSPWPPSPGPHLNLQTVYVYDSWGRQIRSEGPGHPIVSGDGSAQFAQTTTWTIYRESPDNADTNEVINGQGYHSGSQYVLVNPVAIQRLDKNGRVVDEIQAYRGAPTEESPGPLLETDTFPQSSWVRWTHHEYNAAGELTSSRLYTQFNPGDIYSETTYGYDPMGRQNRVTSPGGTITETTFDARGLPTATQVGTSASNLVSTQENQYDNGLGGGNGNLTKITAHVDAVSTRVTNYTYDWRDRQISATGPQNYFQQTRYDNLDRPQAVEERVASAAGKLLSLQETLYDTRGRVYRTVNYGVSPANGALGVDLQDNTWYDGCGSVTQHRAAGAGQTTTKNQYDGLGRLIASYVGYPDPNLPMDSSSLQNDIVYEQTVNEYDDASNLVMVTVKQRYDNATGNGALNGPAGPEPKSRDSYIASWYDGIGRQVASANYGTNDNQGPPQPSNTVPSTTDKVLVSQSGYNYKGELDAQIDPPGTTTQLVYDSAGRVTSTIQNRVFRGRAVDQNVVVQFAYNADSNLTQLRAENSQPGAGPQTTTYVYGVAQPNSSLNSNDLLGQVIYADSGLVRYNYNRQGQPTSMIDQNGTTHEYSYDARGRQTDDRVTAATDPAVDLAIRRIHTRYNEKGLVSEVLSFDEPVVGRRRRSEEPVAADPRHSVLFIYNDFRQLTNEEQRHTPLPPIAEQATSVHYFYADGTNNSVRLEWMRYPNRRVINYSYPGADDALNRVSEIRDTGSEKLVGYTYLGLATPVTVDYTPPDVTWTLVLGSGNDRYAGLDNFSRVKQVHWQKNGATATILVDLIYRYDTSSNRTTVDNQVATTGWDYAYGYDALNRLMPSNRGDLTGGAIVNTKELETWTLDQTGNWTTYTHDVTAGSNLSQTRTHNTVNEITSITNVEPPQWVVPTYDNNGNTILLPRPADPAQSYTLVWDAWNRLVRVNDGATPLVAYAYDGLGRRFTVTSAGQAPQHYFYSSSWQVLEERLGSSLTADRQYLWGLRYIDDYAFQELFTSGTGVRHWGLQDGNWNVVGLTDDSGVVQQRYGYDAYGTVSYLTPTFVVQSVPSVANPYTFTGRQLDRDTRLYHYRARYYDSELGRFISRDPIGVDAGTDNRYCYVGNNPVREVDPSGLISSDQFVAGLLGFLQQFGPRAGVRQCGRVCTRVVTPPLGCVCLTGCIETDLRHCCVVDPCCPKGRRKLCNVTRVQVSLGLFSCSSLGGTGWAVPPFPYFQTAWMPATKRLISGIGGISNVSCPAEGHSGSVCITASAGFSTWSYGARACYDFGSGHTSIDTGWGIGTGTGVSGGGAYTYTKCFVNGACCN